MGIHWGTGREPVVFLGEPVFGGVKNIALFDIFGRLEPPTDLFLYNTKGGFHVSVIAGLRLQLDVSLL